MPNLDELSLRKIIGLILDFYKDPCGLTHCTLGSDPMKYPIANRFMFTCH